MGKLAASVVRRALELAPFPQPAFIQTRHPIVLMHGFGTMAASFQHGMLHDVAMHLRTHGLRAFAPNVDPYNTIAARTASWAERFGHILQVTGAEQLNLIGFSLGGLDARRLVSQMGWHDRIASITTVSSPHRGASLAEFVLSRPDVLRTWAGELMGFLSRASYDLAPPAPLAALQEFCREQVCGRFNSECQDHGAVRYWSWAAEAGKGTSTVIFPPLLIPNRVVFKEEGPNDGIVSVKSAKWGTFMGTLPADHARLVGLGLPASSFDHRAFYLDVARQLQEEGL